ncbi:MAG: radical SAM protein [Promethearchaeota archaeon]
MQDKIVDVRKNSGIPLFGLDFIGIIDRGTNVIEIKPNTTCNLKCKYCFVRSGEYNVNFNVEADYLIENVKKVVNHKGNKDIEIHIAPYGEILLYKDIFKLINALWEIGGVEIISMQSNGLLITPEIVKKLEKVKLSRINISLNTLDETLAKYLCDSKKYDMNTLLKTIELLINTDIDVLIAPVWFPGKNDKDIEDIIKLVLTLRSKGFSEKKIQIGIQKYLIYKTGRKLRKVRPKTWEYFYKQLSHLEKKYQIKLKLGPMDFGIHKRERYAIDQPYKKGDIFNLKIISRGRWGYEYIGRIDDQFGAKILLDKNFIPPSDFINKEIQVRILKTAKLNNTITALYPP